MTGLVSRCTPFPGSGRGGRNRTRWRKANYTALRQPHSSMPNGAFRERSLTNAAAAGIVAGQGPELREYSGFCMR